MRQYRGGRVGIVLISILILQLVAMSVASAAPAAWAPGPGPAPMFHRVQPGETLFAIGRLYGVNPWGIARLNGILNPNIIFVGQVLAISAQPGPGSLPPRPYPGPIGFQPGATYHRVMFGETLFSISRLYGVNPWLVGRANGLFNPNLIYAGQVLFIPAQGPFYRM